MTPGLAGFIASGGGAPSAADDVVAAVMAALERGFRVIPDRTAPAAAERRTWFDTFDWRLFRAGLLLEYVPGRGGSELRLTSASASSDDSGSDSEVRAQPVTGWHPSRPHLVRDIPPGTIADRVGRLIAPRALLPVATVTETAAVSRLLNEDAKTVARLVVERPVVAAGRSGATRSGATRSGAVQNGTASSGTARSGAAARNRPVAPRFAIQPVRGYPGQARRAASLLEQAEGVERASGTVLEDALAALGRGPADYSNKVDAPVTAAMPAPAAVAAILLRLLDTMEANTSGVLRDIDPEFLHDLRVAVRRTRTALKLFGDVLAPGGGHRATRPGTVTAATVQTAAAEFKWLGDLTTPTRDLDVHLLGFDDMAAGLRAAKPDDLEPFRSYLRVRRAREFRVLARGLRSARFRDLTRQWRAALTPLSEPPGEPLSGSFTEPPGRSLSEPPVESFTEPPGEALSERGEQGGRGGRGRGGETPAAALAAERTRRAFAKVAKRGGAITAGSPHESLHDLRKRCKELRYALEFFAPLHDPGEYAAVIGDLKKLQDCLGEFQDSEVQIAEIRSLAAAMQAAGEAPAETLLAMGEVTARLAGTQAAARAGFERRFAALAGTGGRRRMSALLRGAGGGGGGL